MSSGMQYCTKLVAELTVGSGLVCWVVGVGQTLFMTAVQPAHSPLTMPSPTLSAISQLDTRQLEETKHSFTVLLVLCVSTKLLSKSDPPMYTYNDSKDLSYSQTTFQHVSVVATTIIRAVHLCTPKHHYCKLSILWTQSQIHLVYPSTQSLQQSWSSIALGVLQEWQLQGGADKSLAQSTSWCCTMESIVSLEIGVCSRAELQVFSCYTGSKEACQAMHAISTTWRRELSSSFFPA